MLLKRTPCVSGIFYPDDPVELERLLKSLIIRREINDQSQKPKFLISPHAGYIYSGKTAGKGFGLLDEFEYKKVILTGPSHRYYFEGAQASGASLWNTPLGNLTCIQNDRHKIQVNNQVHEQEHSLEVQIPFIQSLFPDAEILPILLSGDKIHYQDIADTLLPLDDDDTLWVISSDFTHFGDSFSFAPTGTNYGESLDQKALKYIQNNDQSGFSIFLKETNATICGAFPVLVAMSMIERLGLPGFKLVDYSNSRQLTNDENSVGYASLIC